MLNLITRYSVVEDMLQILLEEVVEWHLIVFEHEFLIVPINDYFVRLQLMPLDSGDFQFETEEKYIEENI